MITSLLLNILGIVLLKIEATGMFAKVIALISLLCVVVGLVMALINLLLCFKNFKQHIGKFLFSLISFSLGLYALIKVLAVVPLIKSLF